MITDRLRRNAARARARGAPAVRYTEQQVWERGGGRCYLCGCPLDPAHWQIEHVIPVARGGPDVLANVMPAHRACNQAKGARVTTLPDGPLRRAIQQTLVTWARLARVGVPTQPLAPTIAPHVVTLRYATVPGHAHLPARIAAEVRAAVHAPTARVYVHGAELRVELPRWPRRPVPLREMPRRGLRLGIGLDVENRPVGVDFDASPHALVAGQTRSGKSEVLRVIVWHLLLAGAEVILVDTDGATFAPFANAAGLVCRVARELDEAHDAVAHAQRLMNARTVDVPNRPLVLVVDEAHMLPAATRDIIIDIAKRGAKRRVQVVVATHRPTRDVLPKSLTDQLTWAIAGRVKDTAGSQVILGPGESGAAYLQGAGDMLVAHGGHVARIQAALGGPADWAKLAPAATAPQPAPSAGQSADARHVREPNDDRVAFLVQRFRETGARPSAKAIKDAFGGNTGRAMRARDEALSLLNGAA